MPLIDCNITDPAGVDISVGTLDIIATKTTPPVLKGTALEDITPGTAVTITLLPGEYKVYYTDEDDNKGYTGSITITAQTADNTDLVTLLAEA